MSRFRIFTLFAALIALSAAFAACGGGSSSSDPQTIVNEATLQGIESGNLDLSLGIGVQGEKSGHVDVSLSGPFQSESEAELPELALAATAKGSVGGEKVDFQGGLTLLGDKAYVGYANTEYEVDSTTLGIVKSAIKKQGGGQKPSSEVTACQEAAGNLKLADFVENLSDDGSAEVGGTGTTKVSGDLNASGALEAISELVEDPACSEQLNAAGSLPSAAELDAAKGTVQNSVKAAHVDLYVGDDHIVRRISARATIEPPKGSRGGAKRVELDLDLTLTGVNEDQTISAPKSSKPLSDLFLKLGINPIELLGVLEGGGGSGGIGGLLKGLGNAAGGSSSGGGGGGGNSGGGQQSYYECLGEAHTAVDIQNCAGLLQ